MENDNSDKNNKSDTLKKLFTAGLSAAFMTEESIRGFVSELKLPKETLNLLLQGAAKSKEDLLNRVAGEMIRIISKIDFVGEASKFVENHKFRISAEVEVLRKDRDDSKNKKPTPPDSKPGVTATFAIEPSEIESPEE